MERKNTIPGRLPAILGAVVSLYILVSLILGLTRGIDLFPGTYLLRSFRYAAFYVPLYLLALTVFFFLPDFSPRRMVILLASLLPFITLGLFFQVVSPEPAGKAAETLAFFFGRKGAAFFLLLLFLLEFFLLLRLSMPGKKAFVGVSSEIPPGEENRDETEEEVNTAVEDTEPEFILPPPVPIVPSAFQDEIVPEEAPEEPAELIEEPEDYPEPEAGWTALLEEDDEDENEDEDEDEAPDKVPAPKAVVRPYDMPIQDLLDDYPDGQYWIVDEATTKAAEVLKLTLEEFKITAEVTGISKGPVITMFEILPAPGVKLSKIVNLADNIALRLAASRVRIVAPIPGKHAVGIEVPNRHRAIVSFKEMLEADEIVGDKMEIPVILGKDIAGGSRVIDLAQTPHLLIAGATGSGKSVCVNSIICSILYNRHPSQVRIMLIDPKIVELKLYNDIPHLLTPVITEPKRAFQALQYCIFEMERRYSLLDGLGVRDIRSYNRKVVQRRLATEPLPYILIIIDEFADLMATTGKELEATIARLAAMSRAVGLHLVLATQRPSVDVITGLIKANIPSRIAFMVAGKFDSRIIIDQVGAEKLLGRGDMLFTSAWDPNPVRIQGAFLSEEEVERVTNHVKTLGKPDYIDDEIFFDDDDDGDFNLISDGPGDPLMDSAMEIVIEAGKASASYLQRRLKIGYNRAARLVELMEEMGIVGPANGSKPRDILRVPDKYL
ncbi:MAG: DNA translocase FtsK [Spirochaetales bacterium]|nr:DNA translocase FtsK [Spirochaetales bacterium]